MLLDLEGARKRASEFVLEADESLIARALLTVQAETLEDVLEGTAHWDGPPPCRGACPACDLVRDIKRTRAEIAKLEDQHAN